MEEKDRLSTKCHRQLLAKALEIRLDTIEELGNAGGGHIGGAMSIVEILVLLYWRWMRVNPEKPHLPERDRFVLSKGHAAPALYSVLAECGYFPKKDLSSFNADGTKLPSHCDMKRTPGIDFSTGSLGQGFSAAVGIALGQKRRNFGSRTFTIIGDGESQEGQIWEAALFAAHYSLDNLISFTDYNRQQNDGYVDEVMSIDDLNAKWVGFGWHVQRVNGHDFKAMNRAISLAIAESGRPSMIILDTIKSLGFSFGEGKRLNHSMKFDSQISSRERELLVSRHPQIKLKEEEEG